MTEVRMDTLFAGDYDEHWSYIDPTHRDMLNQFLNICPPDCTILDAACGTGKYWSIILASDRSVVGIDQSRQMLLKAQAKYPNVQVEKLGLQEMHYTGAFNGIICVDAMEFVFPEDWPVVMANFHRALKTKDHLYFTVEITSEEELRSAFIAGKQQGLPLVEGEHAHEGGYHYYPSLEQVRQWTQEAQFDILAEAEEDVYHHFLVRKR
jgi:cyclopropane fatty-acyl-phospholipid synthase-like methyltransferase